MMGTPAYMPPEQALGDVEAHGPAQRRLRARRDPVRDPDRQAAVFGGRRRSGPSGGDCAAAGCVRETGAMRRRRGARRLVQTMSVAFTAGATRFGEAGRGGGRALPVVGRGAGAGGRDPRRRSEGAGALDGDVVGGGGAGARARRRRLPLCTTRGADAPGPGEPARRDGAQRRQRPPRRGALQGTAGPRPVGARRGRGDPGGTTRRRGRRRWRGEIPRRPDAGHGARRTVEGDRHGDATRPGRRDATAPARGTHRAAGRAAQRLHGQGDAAPRARLCGGVRQLPRRPRPDHDEPGAGRAGALRANRRRARVGTGQLVREPALPRQPRSEIAAGSGDHLATERARLGDRPRCMAHPTARRAGRQGPRPRCDRPASPRGRPRDAACRQPAPAGRGAFGRRRPDRLAGGLRARLRALPDELRLCLRARSDAPEFGPLRAGRALLPHRARLAPRHARADARARKGLHRTGRASGRGTDLPQARGAPAGRGPLALPRGPRAGGAGTTRRGDREPPACARTRSEGRFVLHQHRSRLRPAGPARRRGRDLPARARSRSAIRGRLHQPRADPHEAGQARRRDRGLPARRRAHAEGLALPLQPGSHPD